MISSRLPDGMYVHESGAPGVDKLLFERSVERDTEHSLDKFKAIVEAEAPVHA